MPICLLSGAWRLVRAETLLGDLSSICALHGIPVAVPLRNVQILLVKHRQQKISNVETCEQIKKKKKKKKKNLGLAGVANYKMCRNDPGDNWQCVKKNKRNKKLHNLLSKCDYKKNMKCTKKKSWEISLLFLFLKSNSEKKLIRIQRCVKALRKKKIISRPAEIYELQPLPVCVLCCLMAAGSERLTVCQCHSLSARRVRAGNRVGEKKNRKKKKKNIRKTRWKCTLRPAEEGSVFLSLLARTPKNKMLRASA